MNTLLIVEDNDFERNALQQFIDWDVLGVRVVDTAHNGKDGLEKAKRHQPDIVISDVKMPVMNGIEMARDIVKVYPETKFIFSSGYEDVGLLKEALEVRAYCYLTKPLKHKELIEVLRKLSAVSVDEKLSRLEYKKITEQFQYRLPDLQARFFSRLMVGEYRPDEASLIYSEANDLKLRMTGLYKLVLIETEFPSHSNAYETVKQFDRVIEQLQISFASGDAIFIRDGTYRIAAIVHSIKEESDKDEQLLRTIESRMATLADTHSLRYVIGVSGRAPDLTGLKALYRQCCDALQRKIKVGYGKAIVYESPVGTGEALHECPNPDRLRQMMDEIVQLACDGQSCNDAVGELMSLMMNDPYLKIDRIQSVIVGLFSRLARHMDHIGEKLETIAGDEIELSHAVITIGTVPEMTDCVTTVLNNVSSCMKRKKLGKDDHIVQEILSILNQEYHQPITLSYLSDKVFLSPNYLRVLFKGKMNISIQEYVTQLRINKAKELLKNHRYKVHEIGGIVGYENSTYFNKVFKDRVQMTPGEYRSKYM